MAEMMAEAVTVTEIKEGLKSRLFLFQYLYDSRNLGEHAYLRAIGCFLHSLPISFGVVVEMSS